MTGPSIDIMRKNGFDGRALAQSGAATVAESQGDDTNIHPRDGLASAERSPIGDTNNGAGAPELCFDCFRPQPCGCAEAEEEVKRVIAKAAAKRGPAPETRPAQDLITVLQCAKPLRLTKTWCADGTVRQYDEAKHFKVIERPVAGIHGVAQLMAQLATRPGHALIRGRFVGAAQALGEGGAFRRVLKNFHDQPLHFVMLDIDRFQPVADPVREPVAAIDEFITAHLPECFHYRSYYWQLSSSAGHPSKAASRELRAHLVFWLETPYTSGQIKAWKLARNIPVDGALFNPVQLHFVADRVLEDGVTDPVPLRSGFVEGFAGDTVALEIPANLTALVREHDASTDVVLVDPRDKPGVIGAFCRAFEIEDVIERWLAEHFEWETPGDPRRLNFADGGGAPGGAFVSDCRQYIVNKHNSDPFANRAANKFDLVRHYVYGHLDDAEDAFDADVTSSTSYHRAVAELGKLAPVQAELEKMREREAAEQLEDLGATGADVLEELRAALDQIRAMSTEQLDGGAWIPVALELSGSGESEVIGEVARRRRVKEPGLKADLKGARATARRVQLRDDAITDGKTVLAVDVENSIQQAKAVERLVLAQLVEAGREDEYLLFGDPPLIVAVRATAPENAHNVVRGKEPPAVYALALMDKASLKGHIEDAVVFTTESENGPKPTRVPDVMLSDLKMLPATRRAVPWVDRGLSVHPVVTRDGRILSADGVYESDRLVLKGATVEGCRPYSQNEASAALLRLRETVLDGFEFEENTNEDLQIVPLAEDAALAMLFTGLVRKVVDIAPLFAITAAMQSSGKTALARRIHALLTGRDMPVHGWPTKENARGSAVSDEGEFRKALFTALLSSPAVLCYDNLPDGWTYRSATLARAITSGELTDRVLGESREVKVRSNTLVVLTGNNIRPGKDEAARCITIRLEPSADAVTLPTRHYRHPDVVAHAQAMRPAVLCDVVGILAGYLRSGETMPTRSRFPQWDRMVRQAIVWADGADVADLLVRNISTSDDYNDQDTLAQALFAHFGCEPFTAAEVVREADAFADGGADVAIVTAIKARGVDPESARAVGKLLSRDEGAGVEHDGSRFRLSVWTSPSKHKGGSSYIFKRRR